MELRDWARLEQHAEQDGRAEVRRLKSDIKRGTEKRDILQKAAACFAKG